MSVRLGWRAATAALAFTAASFAMTSGASAEPKKAEDVHIIFVTHGQANDVYWSVVKNGVQAGQKAMGSKVDYHAPETFDMVQMARLIDAAIAEKPDAIVVSIPDTDALKKPIMDAKAAGIPVGVIDTGIDQVPDWGLDLWVGGASEYRERRPRRRDHGQGRRQVHDLRQPRSRQHQPRRPLPRLQGRPRQERRRSPTWCAVTRWIRPTPPAASRPISPRIPTPTAILALGPAAATRSCSASREMGLLGKIKMGTFDLSPEVLEAVDKGDMLFAHRQPAVPAWATCRSSSSP